MRVVERLVVVSAPLRGDIEERRWYADEAAACIVLTRRRRLLEPHPVFGPTRYRLLARQVSLAEARSYAITVGFCHERVLPQANA
jgi:hypothetical protein